MAEQHTPKYYCDFCRHQRGTTLRPFTGDALIYHIKHEHPDVARSTASAAIVTKGGAS